MSERCHSIVKGIKNSEIESTLNEVVRWEALAGFAGCAKKRSLVRERGLSRFHLLRSEDRVGCVSCRELDIFDVVDDQDRDGAGLGFEFEAELALEGRG